MLRGAACGGFVVIVACGASELPLSPVPDAAGDPSAADADANSVDAAVPLPVADATEDIDVNETGAAMEDVGPGDSSAIDASLSFSDDGTSNDVAASETGDGASFDAALCLPPDAGPPDATVADAAVADAADASCTPTPPATLPQVQSGEVAQVTARCGVDGGSPPMVGPVPASTTLGLGITLPLRNMKQFDICAQLISDPSSPIFLQYLTSDQFAEMYGPTACDYQAIIDWAQARGLIVTSTYSNLLRLDVSATAGVIGAVFNVTFNYYLRPDGSQFYAPNQDPSCDLNVAVSGIDGFDNCEVVTPI